MNKIDIQCPRCAGLKIDPQRKSAYPFFKSCNQCGGKGVVKDYPQEQRWRSIAAWPDTVGLATPNNETIDTHATIDQARGVCWRLMKFGFGGQGKLFPVSVRVEPDID